MQKKIASFACLIATDMLIILASYCLAFLFRGEILPGLISRYSEVPLLPFSYFLSHSYMLLAWFLVFANERLYTKRLPFWQEYKVLIKGSTISTLLIMIIIFITRSEMRFSRTIVITAWLFSLFLLPTLRSLVKLILIRLDIWKKKLIILGVHQTSLAVIQNIRKNRTMGYEVIAVIEDDPQKIGRTFVGIKVLGPFSQLEKITRAYGSKDIMIVTPHLPRTKFKKILADCENISESMWVIPRSGDFITEGVELEVLGDVLTIYIKRNLVKPWNILIKSLFDISLTLLLLPFLMPLMFVIAGAIRLESRGPALFVQPRLGKKCKPFKMYKFRSMYLDNDKRLKTYLASNPEAQKDWQKYRKIKNRDPRATRVGRIIRKFSLDELPQLLNVIEGKMSLVGPRPYLAEELEDRQQVLQTIARVKPGITGLWQTSGRSDVTFEDRLGIDEFYIRNWSLWLDIVILLKSGRVLVERKGAY
jgi:Undecaprenyl-phosphate galactose phosphotransferase WbaP